MAGHLFLIPSALGNIDWTNYLPAETREQACRLSSFVVENAKTARAELKRIGHPLPIREVAIAQLPETPTAEDLDRLLSPSIRGEDIGLMSEAGCPAIADPGALLVRRAHQLGIRVIPSIGPSSLLLALMASGFNGQRFAFHGYLPAREPERSRRIRDLDKESGQLGRTQLFIEAPYRNDALLGALLATCSPATRLCTATDLTLPTERIVSKTIAEWKREPPPSLDRRPTVFLLLSER